jgi:hypothetical protein
MHILARCPKCDAALPVSAVEAPATIRCGRCGREIPLTVSTGIRQDREVDRCPVCGGADFYARKDFDPRVGVTIVAAGGAISFVCYWAGRDLLAYAILALAVLVDLIVYSRLATVTVCYRCHSEFRGSYRRTAPAFDLHTADVLEQEYERRVGRR